MNLEGERAGRQFTVQLFSFIVLLSLVSFALNAKVYTDFLKSHPHSFLDDDPNYEGRSSGSSRTFASDGEQQGQGLNNNNNLGSIQCESHGGANPKVVNDLVYWYDIPSDSEYINPFQKKQMKEKEEKYLIFEKDLAGWNNVRMSFETIITLGISMGRTIVLPPAQTFHMMDDKSDKYHFTFNDFYPLNETQQLDEYVGLRIITMTEFLDRVIAMNGLTPYLESGQQEKSLPPGNRTKYDKSSKTDLKSLYDWLGASAYIDKRPWDPNHCIAFWPSTSNITQSKTSILALMKNSFKVKPSSYLHAPFPVNAAVEERLAEHWAGRMNVCMYHEEIQKAPVVYFDSKSRMLAPFYTFHFYEDWKQGAWMKRFVRDHLRYRDEIFCATARIVEAIQQRVQERDPSATKPSFNTVHIRRGDFGAQYETQKRSIDEIYISSKDVLKSGSTVFIATDERDKSFFAPLRKHYDVCFLDDFQHLVQDLNPNFYGLVDQLVMAKGDVFIGTYYSTFSSYVNRIRGYYNNRDKSPGYQMGELRNSYYFWPEHKKTIMTRYFGLEPPYWPNEHPLGWRKIDKGI